MQQSLELVYVEPNPSPKPPDPRLESPSASSHASIRHLCATLQPLKDSVKTRKELLENSPTP